MIEARRRATVGRRPPAGVSITNGPGKLCQALDIDSTLDGATLLGGKDEAGALALLPRRRAPQCIERTPRIGISKARDALLRFYVGGNPYVSGAKVSRSSGRSVTSA
jgi:DNA-3-methyladenine glycosylase